MAIRRVNWSFSLPLDRLSLSALCAHTTTRSFCGPPAVCWRFWVFVPATNQQSLKLVACKLWLCIWEIPHRDWSRTACGLCAICRMLRPRSMAWRTCSRDWFMCWPALMLMWWLAPLAFWATWRATIRGIRWELLQTKIWEIAKTFIYFR